MSLVAWYPLNENINNQGLEDMSLTQITAPTFVDGKLGKALNQGAFNWTPEQTAKVLNNEELSICLWIYVNAETGSTTDRAMIFGTDGMGEGNNRKFSLFQYPNCNSFHWSWMNDAANTVFTNGVLNNVFPSYQWTHLAVTYKNPVGKIYINGELKHTFTGVSNSSRFDYTTKVIYNSQYHYLNDYRFYNHCLTESEIKEISRGLILHYNFEDPYCEPTENLRKTIYISDTTSTDYQKLISGNDNIGNYYIKPYGAISWSGLRLPSTSVEAGKIYTWSFDIMPNKQSSVSFDGNVSASNYSGTDAAYSNYGYHSGIVGRTGSILPANKWSRVYVTCAANADAVDAKMFHTFNTNTKETDKEIKYYYRNVLFEKKPFPTPYTSSKREDSIVGGGGVVYDSSGFSNDGIVMLETTPNWVNDSAEGQYSVNFDGNQYIQTKDFLPKLIDELTISLWVYRNDWKYSSQKAGSSIISCIEGGGFGFKWEHNLLSFSVYYNGHGYLGNNSLNGGFDTSNLTSGWHYFVGVADRNSIKMYIDGKFHSSKEHNWDKEIQLNSLYHLVIGAEQNGDNYIGWLGKVDDVRIYSTALSNEDIQQLYNVKAHIDKDNNILCDNFVEEHHMFLMDEDEAVHSDKNEIVYCDGRTIKIKINQEGSWQYVWFLLENFIEDGKTYHLHYRVNPDCPKNVNFDNTYGVIGIHKYKISDNSVVKTEIKLTDTNLHTNFTFSVDYSTYKNYKLIFFPTCTDSTSGTGKTYIYDDIDIVEVDTTKKTNISKKYQLTTGNITEEKDKVRFKKHNKTECNEIIEI